MKKLIHGYSKFLDIFEKICCAICIVGTAAMTFIMVYQSIMRYVFSSGLTWAEELCRIIFIVCVMFVSFIAIRRGRHLQMTMIQDLLSERLRPYYKLLLEVLCFVFYIILMKLSIDLCGTARGRTGALEIPYSLIYLCLPIGTGLMILSSIEQFFVLGCSIFDNRKKHLDVREGGDEA